MSRRWEADPTARLARRLGGTTGTWPSSAVTSTAAYAARLPPGVRIGSDERLVVLPGSMPRAAKPDIPDA